jgi:CheY-like chemotaxis protein
VSSPSPPPLPAPTPLAGRRILLVEDTLIVAEELVHILRRAGCTVVGPYPRLSPALDAARRETFDLALLDVNLDGDRVYPVVDALLPRAIPFILLTGYGPESIDAAYRHHPRLTKPFGGEELRTAMQRALSTPINPATPP